MRVLQSGTEQSLNRSVIKSMRSRALNPTSETARKTNVRARRRSGRPEHDEGANALTAFNDSGIF
jgi:hypothetical protein